MLYRAGLRAEGGENGLAQGRRMRRLDVGEQFPRQSRRRALDAHHRGVNPVGGCAGHQTDDDHGWDS